MGFLPVSRLANSEGMDDWDNHGFVIQLVGRIVSSKSLYT